MSPREEFLVAVGIRRRIAGAADDKGEGTTLEEGLEKPVGYIQGTGMH